MSEMQCVCSCMCPYKGSSVAFVFGEKATLTRIIYAFAGRMPGLSFFLRGGQKEHSLNPPALRDQIRHELHSSLPKSMAVCEPLVIFHRGKQWIRSLPRPDPSMAACMAVGCRCTLTHHFLSVCPNHFIITTLLRRLYHCIY